MRTLVGILMLLCCIEAFAGRYRQPAYITNTYFTESAGTTQLFNVMIANEPRATANIVIDLVLDKGTHRIVVDILDRRGRQFDKLYFDAVTAPNDDWTYTVAGEFGGALNSGGIFFKVWDRYNRQAPVHIGTFRLLTQD